MTTMNKSLAQMVKRHQVTIEEAMLYSPDRDALLRIV
jgi:Tfp pilus assembly pilus retraction ATPase PilT